MDNHFQQYKKKDHRTLSNQLDLFHTQDDAPGMIFWHKNGWIIFQELKKFIRKKLQQYQYQEVKSPIMIDQELWKKTGHWDNYYEHIFITASENRTYCIKPMNCPGHIQIFNYGIKSYKDLPLRIAEFGHCHRNEPSGSLHGLMRIREFTQDDAHIFCSIEQIPTELNYCIKMMYDVYHTFGFKKIIVKLSTRPIKRIGEDSIWDITEQCLVHILQKKNIEFTYQPQDGAFYGPKIEFILLDSLKRAWQCGTVQLDFSLPKLLKAKYIDNNNKYQIPVMIHRAILGSIERFIGLITEEYSGFLPTWLAPTQIVLMNVTDAQSLYVTNIANRLKFENFRVQIDLRNEKIGCKIRLHTMHRVPYMIICGNSEVDHGTISIRTFRGRKINNYNIDTFIQKLKQEINTYNFNQLEE
ncbi:threonyl-tRNA synthetase [Candidatus Blochmanniella vafra str. BVAF]|uniref:Threonine--tRNA ligase n=1 Tax=Blochmanniella vafra (strain BVAF) TaxID=859654 RepID=E8Q701_BLOVB|nr:threonyl-tRNA synthetase [Candidatus Blochmannia vafer str. BVAF]